LYSPVTKVPLRMNFFSSLPSSDSELPDNSNIDASSQTSDDFPFPEVQSSLVDSSVSETQEEFEMNSVQSQQHQAPLSSLSTNQDVISSVQIQDSVHQTPTPTPTPHFQHIHTVSIPAQPQQSPPSVTYATLSSHSSISSPPSISSPSTSSPSSLSSLSSPPSTEDEYIEMRRRNIRNNNEASRNYRGREKAKKKRADEELKELQQKNDLLNKKVKHMESIIKGIRAKVITNITQPRVMKRERSSDLDDNGYPENKKSRWEP